MADALAVARHVLGRGVGRKEVSTALAALPPGGGGGSGRRGRRGGRLCYSSVGSLSRRMVERRIFVSALEMNHSDL